jgi:hypothetical protein
MRFFGFFILITTSVFGQNKSLAVLDSVVSVKNKSLVVSDSLVFGQNKSLVVLDSVIPSFKKLENVIPSLPQDFVTKGEKVTTQSFNKGDTIYFTLSRKHKRKAQFSICDSETTLLTADFKPKNNLLTGSFVVHEDATVLLKVINLSYLGNALTLDIKRKIYIVPPPKEELKLEPKIDTITKFSDSIFVKKDTLVYLACTLNLNQSQSFTLDSIFERPVYCAIVNSFKGEVTIRKATKSLEFFKCSNVNYQPHKKTNTVLIYTSESPLTKTYIDSLIGANDVKKDICFFNIMPSEDPQLITVSNLDKVVGVYVRVQWFDIKKYQTVIFQEKK